MVGILHWSEFMNLTLLSGIVGVAVLVGGVVMAAMGASSAVFMGLGGVVFGLLCAWMAYKSVVDPSSLATDQPVGIGSTIMLGAIAALLFFGGLWILIARPF
jgi:hypothetical protein